MAGRPVSDAAVAWDERPEQRRDLTCHELDGEALIYDPVTACTHQLNSTASFIWRRCDGLHRLDRISQDLAATYDVSEEEAFVHSRRLIAELDSRKLLAHQSKELETDG